MKRTRFKKSMAAALALVAIAGLVGVISSRAFADEAVPVIEYGIGSKDAASSFISAYGVAPDTSGGRQFKTVFRNYITKNGTKLMDGSDELKFVSINYPQSTDDNAWEQRNAMKTIKTIGGKVTRSYTITVASSQRSTEGPAYVTGADSADNLTFNDAALNKLDQLLAICNEEGIRIVIPLVDEWSWVGGIEGYLEIAKLDASADKRGAFYTNEKCKKYFKQMINRLLNRVNTVSGIRYKDDPAIIFWETGNELAAYYESGRYGSAAAVDNYMYEWTNEVVDYIRTIDQKHLILDGRMDLSDKSLSAGNKADVLGAHYYTGNFPSKTRNDTRRAHAAGKPFVLGEFGTYTKASDCINVFQAALDAGTNGAMLWSLRAHKDGYGYFFHSEDPGNWAAYHWPGFPSGEYYDETNIMRALYSFAQIANGKAANYNAAKNIPIPAPEKASTGGENPKLFPITTIGDIKWRGVVGGAWYEIQRADGTVTDQNSGAWKTIADKNDYVYDSGRNWENKEHDCIAGYHDKTAIDGRTYSYRLRACNESGVGEWSNIVTAVNAVHRIADDLQLIAVASGDQNPSEIRNVYSYDHSRNMKTSWGSALKNESSESGYIAYAQEIPIKDITITTANIPDEGDWPSVWVSRDDIAYKELSAVKKSSREFEVKDISAADNYYFIKIFIKGNDVCSLRKIDILYTLKNINEIITPFTPPSNAMIQDDFLGEGAAVMYAQRTGNLALTQTAGIEGLAANNNSAAVLMYKTRDDINAFRAVVYAKENADFKVQYSMDSINFKDAKALTEEEADGGYSRYVCGDVEVSEIVRVVKIVYPSGQKDVIVKQVEISSGSARLPLAASSPDNVLEDGEFYFSRNERLTAAYAKTSSSNEIKFTKTLGGKNLAKYDAFYAWVKSDNSNNDLVFQLKETGGKVWEAVYELADAGSKVLMFRLKDFKCASDPTGTINLSSIDGFTFGIRVKSGTVNAGGSNLALSFENAYTGNYGVEFSYGKTGGGTASVYLDNIYVRSLTQVDDFEGYSGSNTLLREAYARNTGGGAFDMYLDVANKWDGAFGLRIEYDYKGTTYAGAVKTTDYLNLNGYDGFKVYYEPDGSGNAVLLQLTLADGSCWESIGYMDAVGPTILYMPWNKFVVQEGSGWSGAAPDTTKNITKFAIYTNEDGSKASYRQDGPKKSIQKGYIYLDEIVGANFVSALAGAAVAVDSKLNGTTVKSFPYTISGTASFVDFVTLQIGEKQLYRQFNVPVANGVWSYEVTEADGIYNADNVEISASILYHNGDVIKTDTGKKININIDGNTEPETIKYETVWEYSFADVKDIGGWEITGFAERKEDWGTHKPVYWENGSLVSWASGEYAGTISKTLTVPNGIYTLRNDIKVKNGMTKAQIVLKSGNAEIRSKNINTNDMDVLGMMFENLQGNNIIEVRNNTITIMYDVEAPSGGYVFALGKVELLKCDEIN